MSEPQRLFFAIDLPAEIREQIIHWRATHFPPEAGRPVAADNLHLTLAFLGEVSAEKRRRFLFSRTDSSTWFHTHA